MSIPHLGRGRQAFRPVWQRCDKAPELFDAAEFDRRLGDNFVVDVENDVIAGNLKALYCRAEQISRHRLDDILGP